MHLSSLVPEYDVVHPIQVDEEGRFVSHELSYPRIRMRRSNEEEDPDVIHYKVSAFGDDLHLHLKRNERLFSPGMKVEVIGKNGRVMKRHGVENCHFTGSVKTRQRSSVAISNCKGLVRNKSDRCQALYDYQSSNKGKVCLQTSLGEPEGSSWPAFISGFRSMSIYSPPWMGD